MIYHQKGHTEISTISAESKIHSTPIHNGALVAFRKQLLDRIGGLPTYTGNDDSTPATLIAFSGHRAIQIDDVTVKEPIQKNRLQRKIRKTQHLILHFLHTKRYAKKLGIYRKTPFDRIWKIESYLHLANPWLLLATILALTAASLQGHIPSTTITLGLVLLFHKNIVSNMNRKPTHPTHSYDKKPLDKRSGLNEVTPHEGFYNVTKLLNYVC